MEYIIDGTHPFFREILVHYSAVLGFAAMINLGRSRDAVKQLEGIVNRERRIPNNFTFPLDMPPVVRGAGFVCDSVLLNAQAIIEAIQGSAPIVIRYEDADPTAPAVSSSIPQPYSLHVKSPPGLHYLAAQVSVGSAYESVKDNIERAYGCDPVSWPKVIEYFRHVRNGCFHHNSFSVRPHRGKSTAIDPANPPQWRSSTMTDDAFMNTRDVFGDFLEVGDCPILLGDVAKRMQDDGVKS